MLKVLFNYFSLRKTLLLQALPGGNSFCFDVAKFTCFTHDLLHPIPQRAEIEAKEIDLKEKK